MTDNCPPRGIRLADMPFAVIDAGGISECGFIGSNNSLGWAEKGVIVVPREHALTVGKLAREINVGDEKSRAGRFKRLGMPLDETVKVE